jgi:hypothetical protein
LPRFLVWIQHVHGMRGGIVLVLRDEQG